MKKSSLIAVSLLVLAGSGTLTGQSAAATEFTIEPLASNAEVMARLQSEGAPPDVVLPPGTDLLQFTRASKGLGPDTYVAPLIISAADAKSDSLSSPYFFSFGTGTYSYSGSSSCHMAPAYLPHSHTGVTVTLNNFFVFALDNNGTIDTTYTLWRKETITTNSPTIMATVTTSGELATVQVLGDTTVDFPIIYPDYVYYVTWCFSGASQGVIGFWLYYTNS